MLAISEKQGVVPFSSEHDSEDDFIIMRTFVVDGAGKLIEGLVADVRNVEKRFGEYNTSEEIEEADDTEDLWDAIRDEADKINILALVDRNRDTGESVYYGDPRFQDAVEYLRQRVDGTFEPFKSRDRRSGSSSIDKSKKKPKTKKQKRS